MKSKGFTLIELLVVIAIIGMLSAVILASLNTARAKAADAAIKENLANARAQAELFYDANGSSYMGTINTATDVCSVNGNVGGVKGIYPNVLAAIQVSQGSGGTLVGEGLVETTTTASCNPTATSWVAQAPLKQTAGTYWCVDNTGNSKQEGAVLAAAATVCP